MRPEIHTDDGQRNISHHEAPGEIAAQARLRLNEVHPYVGISVPLAALSV